jgi:hypothetical protein
VNLVEMAVLLAVCWVVVIPCAVVGLSVRRARFTERLAAPVRRPLSCEGRFRAQRRSPARVGNPGDI